jgi:hypothetical protein
MFNIGLPMFIASLPLLLHVIDKGLEYSFEPLDKEKLRNLMHRDDREVVSRVGECKENFEAVGTYFDFQKQCHFVSTLFIFNIASLLLAVAATAHNGKEINGFPLLFAIFLLVLLALFLKRVWNGKLVSSDVEATRNLFQKVWKGRLVASDVRATRHWEFTAISAFVMVLFTEFALHVMHSAAEGHSDSAEALLAIKNTMESIDTRIETALSPVPKTLERIDRRVLDVGIAQPVDLSYLKDKDCRVVQQVLHDLGAYKGRVDGICDGATNAAARQWQLQERRTIAPAHSADEIVRTLTARDKTVNSGQ